MKKRSLLCLIVFVVITQFSPADRFIREITTEQVNAAFEKPVQPHPRLFLNDQELAPILEKIKTDNDIKILHKAALEQADNLINKEPLQRIKTGRRLLSVSREALRRMTLLGWAWRATGQTKYLQQAEKELLAVSAFSDWNPSHYLDVAEMTTAVAIGYDWFYQELSDQSRKTIRQAIIEKGIQPSMWSKDDPDRLTKIRQNWWISTNNNWNQVCHGGLTCGVLAIMEDEPQLARTIVHRSVNRVQLAMAEYDPDGAYPEGPGYWQYGTTYNVILLAALDSVLGTDFGLSDKSGFAKSAEYYLHVTGPTGLYFNYPDSGSRGSFCPIVYWFANKYNDPSLAWYQQKIARDAIKQKPSNLLRDRTAVMTMLWYQTENTRPQKLSWAGRGGNPVAMFRSSWEDDAVYLGIKGGTPSSNHAHMDIGSFVIDAEGLRWAVDLGPESYNKIESLGMNLWSGAQNSDRWTIFRYNNTSHNTLVVNDQHQRVKGFATLVRYSDNKQFPHAVVDMSAVYEGQLKQAVRGAALLPSTQILIQDELVAGDKEAVVRWAMATPAEIDIKSDKYAVLSQKGKQLQFEIIGDIKTKIQTYSAEPRQDFDQPNPGIKMIGFEVHLDPQQQVRLAVLISSQDTSSGPMTLKPALEWSPELTD